MKIFVFLLLLGFLNSIFAQNHTDEMQFLKTNLYKDEDQVATSEEQGQIIEESAEQSFRERREKLFQSMTEEKKIEILDLEKLYFEDSVSTKAAAPRPDKQ